MTHGYHLDPIEEVHPQAQASLPAQRAEEFMQKLHNMQELAEAAMAVAQDRMEEQTNRRRAAQPRYEVGDKVWLSLKNIRTPQLKKKLAWVAAKYTVIKVVSPTVVELDTPPGVFPKFHVDLIKKAATDPLPSQVKDDAQPPAVIADDGEEEWQIERILRARRHRVKGRQVLVKWEGYVEPTWEPRAELEETAALAAFEELYGSGDGVGEADGARQGAPERPSNAPASRPQRRSTRNLMSGLEIEKPLSEGRRGVMLRAGARVHFSDRLIGSLHGPPVH
jgi:hypothetical protein